MNEIPEPAMTPPERPKAKNCPKCGATPKERANLPCKKDGCPYDLPPGWSTYHRADRGFTENVCPHGVGHPPPGAKDSVHTCDGCCALIAKPPEVS
jgi:hypothetical protein